MKTRLLTMVLIAVFAISTTAMAQPEQARKRNPEQREMMLKRQKAMKQRYQSFFTEEQQTKMKELRLETAKQIKPIKNELNELNAKQKTLTTADKADLKAINKNIDKMAELKASMQKIMAAQHQQVRAMLDEEQLLKFDAMKNKRRGKGGNYQGRQQSNGKHQKYRRG